MALRARIATVVALCSAPACLGPIEHEEGSLPPTVGTTGRFGPICNDGRLSLLDGLSLPRPVHYLAYDKGIVEETGVACAGASAPDACFAELSLLRNAEARYSVPLYFVYTRGDEVGALAWGEDLLEFLGRIDTLNEAAILVAGYAGHPSCSALYEVSDGYVTGQNYLQREILPPTPATCANLQGFAIHVSYDGMIREIPGPIGLGLGACP